MRNPKSEEKCYKLLRRWKEYERYVAKYLRKVRFNPDLMYHLVLQKPEEYLEHFRLGS